MKNSARNSPISIIYLKVKSQNTKNIWKRFKDDLPEAYIILKNLVVKKPPSEFLERLIHSIHEVSGLLLRQILLLVMGSICGSVEPDNNGIGLSNMGPSLALESWEDREGLEPLVCGGERGLHDGDCRGLVGSRGSLFR